MAHPAPRTFTGPVLSPFASGDAPPLAEADFFAYRVLSPTTGASVWANAIALLRVQIRSRIELTFAASILPMHGQSVEWI